MKVLVNAFGISSAGGITVLKKTIYEFLENQENQYYIFVFNNQSILNLVQEFNNIDNIHFKISNYYGLLFRLLRENLYFLSFVLKNKTSLIYIFTGTRQLLFEILTIVKIQNLLFFTKKLDIIINCKLLNQYSFLKKKLSTIHIIIIFILKIYII